MQRATGYLKRLIIKRKKTNSDATKKKMGQFIRILHGGSILAYNNNTKLSYKQVNVK